jgi:DNA-binding transcriptional LysR family regulator
MDLVHVRYFLALCDAQHFTRAARQCGVSQPSLSIAIRSLEGELGGPLFERRPRVRLSALGQSMRPHLEAIWREVKRVEELARSQAGQRTGGRSAPASDCSGDGAFSGNSPARNGSRLEHAGRVCEAIRDEMQKWAAVAKAANIEPQ